MIKRVFSGDSWTLTRDEYTDSKVCTIEAGEWKGLFEVETDVGLKIRPKGASSEGQHISPGRSTISCVIGTGGKIQIFLYKSPNNPTPRTGIKIKLIDLINNERLIEHEVTVGATSIKIYDANAPFKFEILDVTIQCRGASASGTMKLTDGTNDITDEITCETDNAITEAGSVDDAYSTIARNGTLEIVCGGTTVANTKGLLKITIAERE